MDQKEELESLSVVLYNTIAFTPAVLSLDDVQQSEVANKVALSL